jgi:hypothetical protein
VEEGLLAVVVLLVALVVELSTALARRESKEEERKPAEVREGEEARRSRGRKAVARRRCLRVTECVRIVFERGRSDEQVGEGREAREC